MKRIICLAFGLGLLTAAAFPQTARSEDKAVVKTPAKEAKTLIGTNAVIVGRVAEFNQTEKIMRLNLDNPYPRQAFTAVVFPENFGAFTNLASLKGRTVEVSGKITEYRGLPQIVLTSTNQIKVAEPAPVPAKP